MNTKQQTLRQQPTKYIPKTLPRHLQHPIKRLLRGQSQIFLNLDPRLQIPQRHIEFFHRVERHVGADVAVAVAVGARRTNEEFVRDRKFHLVDNVRLSRDDERVAGHVLRVLEDAAGAADIIGMVDDMRRAFGVRGDGGAGVLRLEFYEFGFAKCLMNDAHAGPEQHIAPGFAGDISAEMLVRAENDFLIHWQLR